MSARRIRPKVVIKLALYYLWAVWGFCSFLYLFVYPTVVNLLIILNSLGE